MNENINLVDILKDYPNGTKLYSPVYGEVELVNVIENKDCVYPIKVKIKNHYLPLEKTFTKQGRAIEVITDGECLLFPSKDQRDWSKFKIKRPKFDPKTLKHFYKVLVRDNDVQNWKCNFYSHYSPKNMFKFYCIDRRYAYCIPYNSDTKHLVGTTEEAPEYYRYWEARHNL